jgi:hypothetical protein
MFTTETRGSGDNVCNPYPSGSAGVPNFTVAYRPLNEAQMADLLARRLVRLAEYKAAGQTAGVELIEALIECEHGGESAQ